MSGAVASPIPPNVSSPAARCASVEAEEVTENWGVEEGPVAMVFRCATEVDMVAGPGQLFLPSCGARQVVICR